MRWQQAKWLCSIRKTPDTGARANRQGFASPAKRCQRTKLQRSKDGRGRSTVAAGLESCRLKHAFGCVCVSRALLARKFCSREMSGARRREEARRVLT